MREELDQGLTSEADGSFAVMKARRAEGLALDELIYAQRVYVDLLLGNETLPPDDDERPLI